MLYEVITQLGFGLVTTLGAFLPSLEAAGGAWTQPDGAGIVISKVEYVTAPASFDGAGAPAEGDFYKLHVESYVEFGLTDAITLVGQVDYDTSWIETAGEPAVSEGFGRFGLWGVITSYSIHYTKLYEREFAEQKAELYT